MKKFFITGTDTDAGKSLISAAFLYKAQQQEQSCFGLKPIAAGCQPSPQGLRNDDALLLQSFSAPAQNYDLHNPLTLEPAIAPHLALAEQQQSLSAQNLFDLCQPALSQEYDLTIIEGAGGWLVPLHNLEKPQETLADFAKLINAPVILVVAMRLGCINHALLSIAAIKASGLPIAGWVANHIDPEMQRQAENVATLETIIEAPCLAKVPYLSHYQNDYQAVKQAADYIQQAL